MENELLYQAGKTDKIKIGNKEFKISAYTLRQIVELSNYSLTHSDIETRLYGIYLHLRENKDFTLDMLYDMPVINTDSIMNELTRIDKEINEKLYPPLTETARQPTQ